MRIVSLLPSATEIVCGLGLRDDLVGIGHLSDYPPEIDGLPLVTRPAPARRERAGDERGAAELRDVELDDAALVAARPDLVITRDSDSRGLARALRAVLAGQDPAPEFVSLDAVSLEGVFHSVTTIGAMTEAEDEAVGLLEVLREELSELEEMAARRRDEGLLPGRVVVLQGLDPLAAAGRWVPEQVRRAGAWDVLGAEGEPPAATDWESIREVDPEMLVVAPIGQGLHEAMRSWRTMSLPPFWRELAAVRRGRVFFAEPVYFDRPGPRVLDGVGLLAEIFDPEGFVDTSPPNSWTPLSE